MRSKRTWIGASFLAGIGATACCWGPALLAGLAGVSGTASTFSWLHPLKPYLIGFSVLGLGAAFYQVYSRKRVEKGCERCVAKQQKKQRFDRVLLYSVCVLVFLSYSYPYMSSAKDTGDIDRVQERANGNPIAMTKDSTLKELTFKVDGMSCTGCSRSIHNALMDTEGIEESDVSFEDARAQVVFDPEQIRAEGVIERIEELGFKAKRMDMEGK